MSPTHRLGLRLSLQGSEILKTLLELPTKPQIYAFTRKPLSRNEQNCQEIVNTDSSAWPKQLQELKPYPTALITALGTTRAQAGSFEAQRKIDYDLNLALLEAAKDSQSKIGVLISATGTSAKSMMPYSKMKGQLEDSFQELGFSHTIIVRPGLLVGERQDTRIAEALLRKLATGVGQLHNGLKDFWAQDAHVIARAAVSATIQCAEGKREPGKHIPELSFTLLVLSRNLSRLLCNDL